MVAIDMSACQTEKRCQSQLSERYQKMIILITKKWILAHFQEPWMTIEEH